MKIFCLFPFLIILSFSCTLLEKEVENNDLPILALQHKAFSLPLTAKGTFKTPDDKDYYPIYVEKKGYYSIAVSSTKGADIILSVHNADNSTLAEADDYYKNFGEQIPSLFLEKKLYYILVETKKTQASSLPIKLPYTLMIEPFSLEAKEKLFSLEKEPNNTLHSIQMIYNNTPHYGFFKPSITPSQKNPLSEKIIRFMLNQNIKDLGSYDIDFYTFDIKEKGKFQLYLELTKVKDVNSTLAIFNISALKNILNTQAPQPEYFFTKDDNGYSEGESIEGYPIVGNQRYIIAVLGKNRLNYQMLSEVQKNFYKIYLNIKKSNIKRELEPNDSLKEAGTLKDNRMEGQLASQNDTDIFILDPQKILKPSSKTQEKTGFLVDILIKTQKKDSLSLQILNHKNEILKTVYYPQIPGLLSLQSLLIKYSSPPHYLKIAPAQNKEGYFNHTPYTIELVARPMQKPTENSVGFEMEPNDSLTSETLKENPIKKGVKGWIDTPQDIDTYLFIPKQSKMYSIKVTNFPHLNLALYNKDNLPIGKLSHNNDYFFINQVMKAKEQYKIQLQSTQKDFFDIVHFYEISIQ